MSQTPSAYVNRWFGFFLDGFEVGYVRSVEGGTVKADLITQQVGGQAERVKHLGTPTFDPISLQVGMSVSDVFWGWVKNSWQGNAERRHGQITTYDHFRKPVFEQHFSDALILETTIPSLDAAGKDPLYMGVKFQPEHLENVHKPKGHALPTHKAAQKTWVQYNFKLDIDGEKRVSKIDAFTIKQNVKPLAVGSQRVYQLEPTSLEFPNLTIYVPMVNANWWFDWAENFIVKGHNSADHEKTGSITLMQPDGSKEQLTIKLAGLGIVSITVDKSDVAAESKIKMARIELYCEHMEFAYAGAE